MKSSRKLFVAIVSLIAASCSLARESDVRFDLGVIAIGSFPVDESIFQVNDCTWIGPEAFQDCAATDKDGVHYAFFGGRLAKVSATKGEVNNAVRLPASIAFDDPIDDALAAVERRFGVDFDCAYQAQRKICASSFAFRSGAGIPYSLELSSDETGLLVQVVARTDF